MTANHSQEHPGERLLAHPFGGKGKVRLDYLINLESQLIWSFQTKAQFRPPVGILDDP